jgi:hypothetical protein
LPSLHDTPARKTDSHIMEEENLHTEIRERRVQSWFGKSLGQFLPRGQLDQLVTRNSILEAMDIKEQEVEEEDETLVVFVLQRAKKLFAILVTIRHNRLQDAISLFEKHNFDDSKLPVEIWTAEMFLDSQQNGTQHPFFEMQGVGKRKRDMVWDKSFIYDFQDKQWEFLAPIISTEEMNNCYGNKVIMPFVAQHASLAEGSFGVVSKYEIHKEHIVITDTSHHRIKSVC